MAERDRTLDALKGFGMALVVLGHAIQWNIPGDWSRTAPAELIYAFHMAFLMFMSGWLLAGRIRRPLPQWIAGRARRLLIPFAFWYCVYWGASRLRLTSLPAFLDYSGSLGEYLLRGLSHPGNGLWFLWILFWCSVFLGVFRLLEPLVGWRYMPLALLGAVLLPVGLSRFVGPPMADFGLAQLAWYFPPFMAGYGFASAGVRGERLLRALEPLGLISFPVLAFMRPAVNWGMPETLASASLQLMLFKWATAAAGILTARLLVRLVVGLPQWRLVTSALVYLGRISLEVYVLHLLLLRVGVGAGWVRVLSVWVFALVFAGAVSWLMKRAGLGILFGKRVRQAPARTYASIPDAPISPSA